MSLGQKRFVAIRAINLPRPKASVQQMKLPQFVKRQQQQNTYIYTEKKKVALAKLNEGDTKREGEERGER